MTAARHGYGAAVARSTTGDPAGSPSEQERGRPLTAPHAGLSRLLGDWRFEMTHVALDEPVLGAQSYQLALDGAFVLLRWTYEHPDFPDALALLSATVWHYFDVRGVTRLFDVTWSDDGWSVVRLDDDFGQRWSGRFVGDDEITGTGEISRDGGRTWQHDFSIRWLRTPP